MNISTSRCSSVEIQMMEKQISKKKLERLTIHGGDFRKAGERSGANLTISRLRQLLEDEVGDMSRNERGGADISDAELDLVMDRGRLFGDWGVAASSSDSITSLGAAVVSSSSSSIPTEGLMYDLIISDETNSLGGVE